MKSDRISPEQYIVSCENLENAKERTYFEHMNLRNVVIATPDIIYRKSYRKRKERTKIFLIKFPEPACIYKWPNPMSADNAKFRILVNAIGKCLQVLFFCRRHFCSCEINYKYMFTYEFKEHSKTIRSLDFCQ